MSAGEGCVSILCLKLVHLQLKLDASCHFTHVNKISPPCLKLERDINMAKSLPVLTCS